MTPDAARSTGTESTARGSLLGRLPPVDAAIPKWGALSRDGRRLVLTYDDFSARVWNSDGTGEPILLNGHTARIVTVQFSPDGTRVLTGSEDQSLRIWPLPEPESGASGPEGSAPRSPATPSASSR